MGASKPATWIGVSFRVSIGDQFLLQGSMSSGLHITSKKIIPKRAWEALFVIVLHVLQQDWAGQSNAFSFFVSVISYGTVIIVGVANTWQTQTSITPSSYQQSCPICINYSTYGGLTIVQNYFVQRLMSYCCTFCPSTGLFLKVSIGASNSLTLDLPTEQHYFFFSRQTSSH